MISVIVPVFNSSDFLPECIESILNQTFEDFELLLIDDGSSDESGLICDRYASKDARIIVIHKRNEGVSVARNTGLNYAKGQWITFIDSDDWIEKECFETLVLEAESSCDFVIAGLSHISSNGNRYDGPCVTSSRTVNSSEDFIQLSSIELLTSVFPKLYKKSIIVHYAIRFQDNLRYGEDRLFNLEYIQHVRGYKTISKSLYNYRDVATSLTHIVDSREKLFSDMRYCHVFYYILGDKQWIDNFSRIFLANKFFNMINDNVIMHTNNSSLTRSEIRKILSDCYYSNQKLWDAMCLSEQINLNKIILFCLRHKLWFILSIIYSKL